MDSGGDNEDWTTGSLYCQKTSNDGWRGAKFFIGNSTDPLMAKQCGEDLDDGKSYSV